MQEKGSQGSHAALPEAGQFRSVEVGHGQGRLVLLLLAEPVIKVNAINLFQSCFDHPGLKASH